MPAKKIAQHPRYIVREGAPNLPVPDHFDWKKFERCRQVIRELFNEENEAVKQQ